MQEQKGNPFNIVEYFSIIIIVQRDLPRIYEAKDITVDDKYTLELIQDVQSTCKDVDDITHEVKLSDGQDKIEDEDVDKKENFCFYETRSKIHSVDTTISKVDKSKVEVETCFRKADEVTDIENVMNEKSLPCDKVKSKLEPSKEKPVLSKTGAKLGK